MIAWDHWDTEGGFAAAKGHATPEQAAEANAQVYETAAASQRATAVASNDGPTTSAGSGWQEQSIAGWRAAVAAGRMTETEFDKAMADLKRATGG